MEKFTFFWQSKSPFSQWHYAEFRDTNSGIAYTCCEQYMMFHKALLFKDMDVAQLIITTPYNPKEYKRLGRKVRHFNNDVWNEHCKAIVYEGNKLKFETNPELMKALRDTKGTTLVEASPYDDIWGIKLPAEDPRALNRATWQGTNWLGEILTQLRIDLIGE